MIPHENIFSSIKTQSVEDVITMGNGKQERSGVAGDVKGSGKVYGRRENCENSSCHPFEILGSVFIVTSPVSRYFTRGAFETVTLLDGMVVIDIHEMRALGTHIGRGAFLTLLHI
jgi:hypothetical protein